MADALETPSGFWEAGRGGVVHVANIKGGVGKSTLAANLAASLSKRGPALLIDLDMQGGASAALGVSAGAAPKYTSRDLFKRRFESAASVSVCLETFDFAGAFAKLEEMVLCRLFGGGAVDDAIARAAPALHVVAPAGSGLFNHPAGYQYGNFLHNLGILKQRYKYIVIDTPSVWNRLARFLYVNCDLNLIPVTLDALSANSFKAYLTHVKRLISHDSHVRLRIVKNGVGRGGEERGGGEADAVNQSRLFLDSLCEQAATRGGGGFAFPPRSIMFDLEIPESAAIRDAQGAGKSVHEHGGDPAAAEAFDLLARSVQQALNCVNMENVPASALEKRVLLAFKAAAAAALLALVALNPAIPDAAAPRPVAPQQLAERGGAAFVHTFGKGDNAARMAKHAICIFRAVVPSQKEIAQYLTETLDAYNMTRAAGAPKIVDYDRIPEGAKITFYPPISITNKQEKALVPAYKFFMDMVNDPYPYVTGDWCERGTGGGQPHYAMDVAAAYGSEVLSPVDGVAALKTEPAGGRTVAVMFGNEVISFSHLEKRLVEEGDAVKKGMPIGTVGMTGRTSGPHVHIMYGITSLSRHDLTFAKNNYRVTDPKYLFYKMAFGQAIEDEPLQPQQISLPASMSILE